MNNLTLLEIIAFVIGVSTINTLIITSLLK